jgi:hypothetical protein
MGIVRFFPLKQQKKREMRENIMENHILFRLKKGAEPLYN